MSIELFVDEETKKRKEAEEKAEKERLQESKAKAIMRKVQYMKLAIEICKAKESFDVESIKKITEELENYFEG